MLTKISSTGGAAATASILLLLTTFLTSTIAAAKVIAPKEMNKMIGALRSHGYNLISNAITTSDLRFQFLSMTPANTSNYSHPAYGNPVSNSVTSFTLFAPKDTHLFSLDMASNASSYVRILRYHVIPNRQLTVFGFRYLYPPYLDTLLSHHSLLVTTTAGNASSSDVTVDGIRISDPDLYVGSGIVVHGLDGILVTGANQQVGSTFPDKMASMKVGWTVATGEIRKRLHWKRKWKQGRKGWSHRRPRYARQDDDRTVDLQYDWGRFAIL